MHKITKCRCCGATVSECRCPSKDKAVTYVDTCNACKGVKPVSNPVAASLDDCDPIHDQIRKAEERLKSLYAKRANRHVIGDWHWCNTGRHKSTVPLARGCSSCGTYCPPGVTMLAENDPRW